MIREDLQKVKRMIAEMQLIDCMMRIGKYICPAKKGQCLKDQCPCYHPGYCSLSDVIDAVRKKMEGKEHE